MKLQNNPSCQLCHCLVIGVVEDSVHYFQASIIVDDVIKIVTESASDVIGPILKNGISF